MFRIAGVVNYLLVIFLNAFTDLGHKIIVQNTVFKVYDGSTQIVLTAIVNSLMLLPFILMFSPAGFLADKFPKNLIMKYASISAVFITLLITYSYYQGWFLAAFALTFLLALQSAIYGPAKYGYIKELVGLKFISAGNGAVQAITTSAILIGIIFYTALFEGMIGDVAYTKEEILKVIAPLGWLLVLGSVIEWYLASKLPNKMAEKSLRAFRFKRYIFGAYLKKNIMMIKRKKEIFDNIIALGLFWSISQVILAIFGEYAKSALGITNALVVQGIMSLAVFGIVFGSILAANFSKYYINTGLSALSAVGVTIVVLSIPFTTSVIFLAIEFMLFGLFSGLLMVPLNAKIQYLSPNVHLGTILAGNNFIQTIFMFIFLIITTLFAYFGANAKILFYIMAIVGLFLSVMLFRRYFVMLFWVVFELMLKSRHSYKYVGLENIPKDKGVLLLGNHVSWVDWFIVQLPIERRINYMIDKDIYNWNYFNAIFKKADLIPLSSKASKNSFFEASNRLKNGKIIAIFPEGEISRNSDVSKFYRGYEFIERDGADIVPFYIDGVFGSIFSRHKGKTKKSFFKKREITVHFGKPISDEIKADELRNKIIKLKGYK
ncbi:1-acyl-sn-glycerol-3-phosphate acyltransferase [Candidatus Sulfurimonas marisnigri]|uniref:1-acyl-sn-glycerol-3-phosphate acyltransferase n=1 Tax=Candidatus Sulfurimonas marisnigri TaxID=2740405 RepID=A0A7S7RPK1_9BACT|nr:MFS transporter [Candidatus Sulfurimonas marisnigri]QOY53681.1 1-acyl-sn-glycerol-3-phosphate acyltransferase [Candidatus Sulfurimonas marisnigri]